jgi:hypothetical protein
MCPAGIFLNLLPQLVIRLIGLPFRVVPAHDQGSVDIFVRTEVQVHKSLIGLFLFCHLLTPFFPFFWKVA